MVPSSSLPSNGDASAVRVSSSVVVPVIAGRAVLASFTLATVVLIIAE